MAANYRSNAFRHGQSFRNRHEVKTEEQQVALTAAQAARRAQFLAACNNALASGEARRAALAK